MPLEHWLVYSLLLIYAMTYQRKCSPRVELPLLQTLVYYQREAIMNQVSRKLKLLGKRHLNGF